MKFDDKESESPGIYTKTLTCLSPLGGFFRISIDRECIYNGLDFVNLLTKALESEKNRVCKFCLFPIEPKEKNKCVVCDSLTCVNCHFQIQESEKLKNTYICFQCWDFVTGRYN